MRLLQAIGLAILFALGVLAGIALAPLIVPFSWYRRARAVHADGILCRGELISRTTAGERLAGPALIRLSGAFNRQLSTETDVLGIELRLQRTASDDPRIGDQDLLLASFESFHTAARDRANTNVGDYLANRYSTVAPWWLAGVGPVTLWLVPPATPPAVDRGADRLARLDADLAADRARFALATDRAGAQAIAELRLTARITIDDRGLHASVSRCGRGVRPVGFRNGIRATIYPLSQLARGMRGG